MAEQWDPATGESRGPGGPGLNRNALQATLADLVRDADGPAAGAPAPAPGGRPVVPGAPVPAPSGAVRPLRGPSAPRPVVDFDEFDAASDGRPSAGVPSAGEAPRPAAARPRPFAPENFPPAPTGNGPAGMVRPGSGVPGGVSANVGGAGPIGGGFGGGRGGGTIGAGSLSGRITPGGDLGDNLARLAPTPTEQPTVALRKRARGDAAKNDDAERPAQPAAAPAPAPQPRPVVAIEAWSPHYDDILPQRPTRSGRAFRRAR